MCSNRKVRQGSEHAGPTRPSIFVFGGRGVREGIQFFFFNILEVRAGRKNNYYLWPHIVNLLYLWMHYYSIHSDNVWGTVSAVEVKVSYYYCYCYYCCYYDYHRVWHSECLSLWPPYDVSSSMFCKWETNSERLNNYPTSPSWQVAKLKFNAHDISVLRKQCRDKLGRRPVF